MCLTNNVERFFPEIYAKLEQNGVIVWRLPIEISQSRFGGREDPSNACTLIVIKLAELIHRNNIRLSHHNCLFMRTIENRSYLIQQNRIASDYNNETSVRCCPILLTSFIEAIVNGNKSHESALKKRMKSISSGLVDPYFTIPDALVAVNNPFREIDFSSVVGPISQNLPSYLRCIIHHPKLEYEEKIYIIMIAFQRSVLFVYERSSDTITLLDTHLHGIGHGGLIASCHLNNLRFFGQWVSSNIFQESLYLSRREKYQVVYELSVLNFCGDVNLSDCSPSPSRIGLCSKFSIFPELDSSSESSSYESSPEKQYFDFNTGSFTPVCRRKRPIENAKTATSTYEFKSEKRMKF